MGQIIFFFFLSQITLFEKKYDIKLITLISMYHLKPLVSLGRFIKNWNADVQIALCTDTVQILCTTTFHRKILLTVVYFEDTVTYFDKLSCFP